MALHVETLNVEPILRSATINLFRGTCLDLSIMLDTSAMVGSNKFFFPSVTPNIKCFESSQTSCFRSHPIGMPNSTISRPNERFVVEVGVE